MPRFGMVLRQLRQSQAKNCGARLLRLPFFHPLRNLTNKRAEEYLRVPVYPRMQSAGVRCRLAAAETTCAHPQLGEHLPTCLRRMILLVIYV